MPTKGNDSGEGFSEMTYMYHIVLINLSVYVIRASEAGLLGIILSALYPICSIVSLVLRMFYLQNTKFGVRVPFALLLAYRVPAFGVLNTV